MLHNVLVFIAIVIMVLDHQLWDLAGECLLHVLVTCIFGCMYMHHVLSIVLYVSDVISTEHKLTASNKHIFLSYH